MGWMTTEMWLYSWQGQDTLLSKDAQTGFGTPSVSKSVQLVGSFLGENKARLSTRPLTNTSCQA